MSLLSTCTAKPSKARQSNFRSYVFQTFQLYWTKYYYKCNYILESDTFLYLKLFFLFLYENKYKCYFSKEIKEKKKKGIILCF